MHERDLNALSAWTLLASDATARAIEADAELSPRELAALVLIRNRPGCAVDWLHGEIDLTQSGAVRLVDRLSTLSLVQRERLPGRREVALYVTRAGEARVARGTRARAAAIDGLLAPLTVQERGQLVRLVRRALAAGPRSRDAADVACRLCDWDACGADCPLDAAVARIHGR